MQYNENAKLDPSQVGSGGGRRGTTMALGGGGILVVIVALLFGLNPGDLLGGSATDPGTQTGTSNPYAQCTTGADIAKDRGCRFVAYTNSIQAYWQSVYSGYEVTQTKIFSGQIATGCGTATAAVGPFYCPADKFVYLDDSFFDDMLTGQLGAEGGDAAEAYVIAHEYGHHISDLTGTLAKAQASGNSTGPKSAQVRLELQADCFAGVWLANAASDPDSPIKAITADDVNRAVDAALAVGDDRIQLKSTGSVSPESWTHGSAAMRKQWLATGFNSGDPSMCNTFAANALG
ncbi:neutral zinc metallopeptidase [Propionicimonas sp.]|uniref:KPN_02809 family neutral zinc metallopeptidase n=1 Tax=Propionicimonas sp. TaxID=1955623 RepID=UPI0039E4F055